MVRSRQTSKKGRKKKPTIGDSEFNSLPASQQKRIRELASGKAYGELSTTVKPESKKSIPTRSQGIPTKSKSIQENKESIPKKKDTSPFGKIKSTFGKVRDVVDPQGLRQMREEGKIKTGSLPIGPGAGTTELIKGAGKIGGEIAAGGKGAGTFAGVIGDKVMKGLEGARKLVVSKAAIGTASLAAGISGTMTWLANDNIIGGAEIFTRDLADAVKWGGMPEAEAMALMEDTRRTVNMAADFTEQQTSLNPLLWPFRNIIMENIEKANRAIDLQTAKIQGFGETPEDLNTSVSLEGDNGTNTTG